MNPTKARKKELKKRRRDKRLRHRAALAQARRAVNVLLGVTRWSFEEEFGEEENLVDTRE